MAIENSTTLLLYFIKYQTATDWKFPEKEEEVTNYIWIDHGS